MNKEVKNALEETQKLLPWLTEEDTKDPIDLRKRANEYSREGEYYETYELDEVEAKKKYDIAATLETLATVIETNP
jgi:hypothetical protein